MELPRNQIVLFIQNFKIYQVRYGFLFEIVCSYNKFASFSVELRKVVGKGGLTEQSIWQLSVAE